MFEIIGSIQLRKVLLRVTTLVQRSAFASAPLIVVVGRETITEQRDGSSRALRFPEFLVIP